MAGVNHLFVSELSCKPIQDLVASGDEPPERYLYKESYFGVNSSSLLLAEVPVVDLSLLASSSTKETEVEKLKSGLFSWGCLQVINHGVETELLEKLCAMIKEFFALPMEEKLKYSREADSLDGYGNDMVLSENQILDWVDRLYITLAPEDQQKLKFWPENPTCFREVLMQYSKKMRVITKLLVKALAKSLDLEEDTFLNQYGERELMFARFNFYPPCPRPDRVLGLKSHSDGTGITILLQDPEVEGLQLLKDEQWFRVPIIPHALLVNLGDQTEIMSNGIFKSPVHRAVTNSEKERISLAVFCAPAAESEVKPVEELISEERPKLYKTVKDYGETYFQYYQQGKRPIDAVKIETLPG